MEAGRCLCTKGELKHGNIADYVPERRFRKLREAGLGIDKIASVMGLAKTWVEVAASRYGDEAPPSFSDKAPTPEEEAASASGLELAPMVLAAAMKHREKRLREMAEETDTATNERVYQRHANEFSRVEERSIWMPK